MGPNVACAPTETRLVPYIGPISAAVPAVAIALVESPTQALLVAAVYLGLQQLESNVILPIIVRTQTRVDSALVLFALAAGFAVGGVLGAIASIPLFAALRVIVVFAVCPGNLPEWPSPRWPVVRMVALCREPVAPHRQSFTISNP